MSPDLSPEQLRWRRENMYPSARNPIQNAQTLDGSERELRDNRGDEKQELAEIYIKRGLDSALAMQVAEQLMAHDALGAHARDELGISATTRARPIQAALASGAAFSMGAILPLLVAIATPDDMLVRAVTIASLLCLALLGIVAARTGGSSIWKAAIRVLFWGALAMAVTAGIWRRRRRRARRHPKRRRFTSEHGAGSIRPRVRPLKFPNSDRSVCARGDLIELAPRSFSIWPTSSRRSP